MYRGPAQLHGHEARLLHARHVKAYFRRTKSDAANADPLVLADRDTSLHPIPIKSDELRALQELHRIREQWKRARVAQSLGLVGRIWYFRFCGSQGYW